MPARSGPSSTGSISRWPVLPPAGRWMVQPGHVRDGVGFKGVIANWIQGSLKITMYQPQCIARLTAGEGITLYPGCDKTGTTCREKFNNQDQLPGGGSFSRH